MRWVTVVTGLVTEKAMARGDGKVIYACAHPIMARDGVVLDGSEKLAEITSMVLPISDFHRLGPEGRDDWYVAWTPEVEDLLGVPYSAMTERLRSQEAQLIRLREKLHLTRRAMSDATLWQRLVFLVTRRLPLHGG